MYICTNAMTYHWLMMEQLKEIEDSELNQLLYANSCWLNNRRILQKNICIVNSKLKCLPIVQQTNKKNPSKKWHCDFTIIVVLCRQI